MDESVYRDAPGGDRLWLFFRRLQYPGGSQGRGRGRKPEPEGRNRRLRGRREPGGRDCRLCGRHEPGGKGGGAVHHHTGAAHRRGNSDPRRGRYQTSPGTLSGGRAGIFRKKYPLPFPIEGNAFQYGFLQQISALFGRG